MPSFVQDLMIGLGKGYFIPKNSFFLILFLTHNICKTPYRP
jgi:hypothetical protein